MPSSSEVYNTRRSVWLKPRLTTYVRPAVIINDEATAAEIIDDGGLEKFSH